MDEIRKSSPDRAPGVEVVIRRLVRGISGGCPTQPHWRRWERLESTILSEAASESDERRRRNEVPVYGPLANALKSLEKVLEAPCDLVEHRDRAVILMGRR